MKFIIKNKNIIYLLSFYLLVLGYCLCVTPLTSNDLWNYGFSYALVKGEILYKDFNLVIGPFYPMFMALSLLIKNNILSYMILHSGIVTFFFYLLYKLYDKKVMVLVLLSVIFTVIVTPSYNQFILVLIILLVYLEKKKVKNSDFFIGFILAISFFTKQSVGLLLLIPSLIFRKDIRIKERLFGFLIPMTIFVFYFLITKTLFLYVDYCFLGLFEFGNHNRLFLPFCFIVFVIISIVALILLIQNRKHSYLYYYFIGFSLAIPIIDSIHLFFVIFLFMILIMDLFSFNFFNYRRIQLIFFIAIFFVLFVESSSIIKEGYKINDISHFEYKYISRGELEYSKELLDYLEGKEFTIYSDNNYFYKIALDQKIDSLDIINYGNHGYDGSKKIISNIQRHKNRLYLIPSHVDLTAQINQDGYNYIVHNASKKGQIGDYDVYEFK